jgi:hypothetical protein
VAGSAPVQLALVKGRIQRRGAGHVKVLLALTILLIDPVGFGSDSHAVEQQGVAIDLGRIDVDDELDPGSSYQLPTVRVRNPGTIASGYRMAIQPIADTLAPDEGWFVFTPASFELDPEARQPVEVTLRLPADAEAGTYEALVSAQVAPAGEGARVGAAAATRLTFQVAATPPPREPPPVALGPAAGWLLGLLVLLALWLLVRLARRYNVRIERRP